MSISHLVANDPEIPLSNIIQEVQIFFQTGCTYKRAWYARKFAIERIEIKSREHKVTTYNLREGIYMVKSPIRVSGTGINVYTLRINNKSFCCGKWQTYTLPCSHVLAVHRENGSRADTYVPEIYSRQTYRRTYQANFYPVLSENFWRDVSFNLTFYPSNMKKEQSRKQGKRFQGEWIIEIRILSQDVTDVSCRDIIKKNCNNPGPSNV
ncbi:hypothetical protein M9H77_13734 [Catharanthus roseus]|uniref:Uncharacterized protein n=1 Tax=Catharanthus roseus TaxID=4058 RepID=A0ACC0BL05_CATRO|nr:hypothetical protein M9H77_13734 [Catharanthus roseus]